MFQITENANGILKDIITREKQYPTEELFLRLSMGIG